MTSAATEYAKQLAIFFVEIDNAKQPAKDILASAKDAGYSPRVLKQAAKELNMDADKRTKLYADEEELDTLRLKLGLLDGSEKGVAIANKVREQKFVEAVKDVDQFTGGNVTGDYLKIRTKLRNDDIAAAKNGAA